LKHGILLIDKPTGLTSHDVVGRVRRILGQKSVGHTGTLDPLASGLMLLVLGEATKLSQYLMAEDKTYLADIKLGETTTTLDRMGEVLSAKPVELEENQVHSTINSLNGDFEWPVPIFSAKKVDGEKLYEKARRGEEIELPVKTMSFFDVTLKHLQLPMVQVQLSCSKGGFIRTWADQMGQLLGVGGHLSELRRLRVGSYHLDDATTLEELESQGASSKAFKGLMALLDTWKTVKVSGKEERLIENGQIPFDLTARLIPEQKESINSNRDIGVRVLDSEGFLKALLQIRPGQGLKILRVFKLDRDAFSH